MKISIITPNRNGERYLEQAIRSVTAQRVSGLNLEYIVVDGDSSDGSLEILDRYRTQIDRIICEKDRGPASAINKGFKLATGDVVGWLNADDLYLPGALERAVRIMDAHADRALCFGRCLVVNETGDEIRRAITRFKECFYPFSCRFVIQSINYISQPAMFFRRDRLAGIGPLREDLKAAWDYELLLRLWPHGGAVRVPGPPLAAFRWHKGSISGQYFRQQFKEEFEVAVADAGRVSPQALLHWGVRWGIVGSYSLMAWWRGVR